MRIHIKGRFVPSAFKLQGGGSIGSMEKVEASLPFFIGRCPKVVFKSRVTSHNNDTSKPLEAEVPQRDFRVWPSLA